MGAAHPAGAQKCSEYTTIVVTLPENPFAVALSGWENADNPYTGRVERSFSKNLAIVAP